MELSELRHDVRAALEDPSLTYRQRIQRLATLAENALEPPPVSEACREALDKRVICDMYEGNAPYRPRYLLPDYARALDNGSEFLELAAPKNLDEAVTFLLAMYTQVPSITATRCTSATWTRSSIPSATASPTPSWHTSCGYSGSRSTGSCLTRSPTPT